MKLTELEPQFMKYGEDGKTLIHVDELSQADGVWFLCPLCFNKNKGPVGTHAVLCWFKGHVPDSASPGPGRWSPSGTDYSNLSLVPSVWLNGEGCGWHGFITNGQATNC